MTDYTIFTLSDLTEDFFCKLCYIEQMRFSVGGSGYILMITEAGQEYLLGEEGYDENNPQNIVPLLAACAECDEVKHRKVYCIENNGWVYAKNYVRDCASDILIRSDLYEKINKLYYEKEHRKLEQGDCYKLVQCVLKPEEGMQRKVYTKTKEKWDKEEIKRRETEENRKRISLTAKDIEWNPVYMDNLLYNPLMGTYAFLFKKEENGEIVGYKWTIDFQYEKSLHGKQKDAPIEAYNLYFKEYRCVAGVLGYRKPGYSACQCYEKSTIRDGIHNYGKFIRSYKTLELAKEAVLYRSASIGGGDVNQENIIRVSMDEQSILEMERNYETVIAENEHINIDRDITFRELRCCLSVTDRLSICMLETEDYENFIRLADVPAIYDTYYVHRIGGIMSQFYEIGKYDYAAHGKQEQLICLDCVEIVLSKEPKSV